MSARRGGRQHIPRPPSHRPGSPAPWSVLAPEQRRLTLADVRERLVTLPPAGDPAAIVEHSRPAAVLLALFEEDAETRVILTKRPDTMPSHRGEIAFPGGKHDPHADTDLVDTALREASEEIGLDTGAVEIVARLEGIATVGSRFVITPFVGLLPGRPNVEAHPHEVVAVFDVALSELMDDGVFREERWDTWIDDLSVHFYELAGETVWGATARILTGFLTHLVTGS